MQTPRKRGVFFLFTEEAVDNLPLFIGYVLVVLGVIAGLAGNREKLLARVRHQDKDDTER
jgi:hypothetical protein